MDEGSCGGWEKGEVVRREERKRRAWPADTCRCVLGSPLLVLLGPSRGYPPLGFASRAGHGHSLLLPSCWGWERPCGELEWEQIWGKIHGLLGWPSDGQLPHVGTAFRSMDTCASTSKRAGEGPIPRFGSRDDLQ